MEFFQKKGSTRLSFTLYDNYFNFDAADKSGRADLDVAYGDLPKKTSVRIEHNEWLRNVGILWILLGLVVTSIPLLGGDGFQGLSIWLYVGSICFVWARFTKARYTQLTTDRGAVLILQNKEHDVIIAELKARKDAQLLDWYGKINTHESFEDQVRKFEWLKGQGVLSDKEFELSVAQLKLELSEPSSNSAVTLLN